MADRGLLDAWMAKAVIFDMDGVIFDSERAVFRCWKALSEKYGFSDLETPYRRCIGVNAAATREIFLSFYGGDFPYDAYQAEVSRDYHARYDGGRLPLKPGIRELLRALRERSLPLAVASSTRTRVVSSQLRDAGLLGFFGAVIGGDQVTRSKPDPEIFLMAAAAVGAAPAGCAVIEDSFNGIRAAARGGMIPVMVPDMLPPDEEMRQTARVIAADHFALRALLCGADGAEGGQA